MKVVFKQLLDDGVRRCCEVDELWNWSGDDFIIHQIKQVLVSYRQPLSIAQLPDIFSGVFFWASIENDNQEERKLENAK